MNRTVHWDIEAADMVLNTLSEHYERQRSAMAPEDRKLLARVIDDLDAFVDGAHIVFTNAAHE
jgi:hypothetical protein